MAIKSMMHVGGVEQNRRKRSGNLDLAYWKKKVRCSMLVSLCLFTNQRNWFTPLQDYYRNDYRFINIHFEQQNVDDEDQLHSDEEELIYDSESSVNRTNESKLSATNSLILDDDDDLDEQLDAHLGSSSLDANEPEPSFTRIKAVPRRKRSNNFILDEAEDVDLDEDDLELCTQAELAHNRTFLSNFIDDSTQVDHGKSLYLKSVKENHFEVPNSNRYKLKYDYDPNIEVYSQAIDPAVEDEEYEMDSFCNDDIVYDHEDPGSEVKPMVNFTPSLKLRSKKVVKKRTNDGADSPPFNQIKKKKFKRIIIESP